MTNSATTKRRFTIAGTGCGLLDYIYGQVDFASAAFRRCRSETHGDGGLEPGKLSFTDDFEAFTGRQLDATLVEITAGKPVDAVNIGGPSIVALIHAAQILDPDRFAIRYVGAVGNDDEGAELRRQLARTPLSGAELIVKPERTPRTVVLSDPRFDHGRGERTFINTIGAAGQLDEGDLDDTFFAADLVAFGGTAIAPGLHDRLDRLLARAKTNGAFTVVNTVYDFRAQRQNPTGRWPLGASDESYRRTDLLLTDLEEALRLSGTDTLDAALAFFIARGVGAVIVTNGARDVALGIGSERYRPSAARRLPVSQAIVAELAAHPERKGDTTGCGDNFVGGVIADLARQLAAGAAQLDLEQAIAWGAVSGGLACFSFGGVYYETQPGEKLALMAPYLAAYRAASAQALR
ncbi:MAG: carbohydrate kinase family protein [Propionivibrio sp.]